MIVIAIVIGNNNYYEPYKLNNAVNDAMSMVDVFYRLGYTVVSEYGIDQSTNETAGTAPVYNLKGQRVNEHEKGIVIKNGKKVVMK